MRGLSVVKFKMAFCFGTLAKVKDLFVSEKTERSSRGISGLIGYVSASYLYKIVLDYMPFTVSWSTSLYKLCYRVS